MRPLSQKDRCGQSMKCSPSHITRNSIAAVIVVGLGFGAAAQNSEKTPTTNDKSIILAAHEPGKDGNPPRRHFRLPNPAELSNEEAKAIYGNIQEKMARNYASSGVKPARKYQKWQRYNTMPFRSATHGRRFVNHYANPIASAYGKYENAGKLPVGSIIAKDSLAVTDDNKILPGPLFLMEKMPAGFNYVSGDWRYTMVMPDGSMFGTTNGVGSDNVKFCIACHLAVEAQDHLYFPPKQYRRN
jgi:Cytochrome P460